MSFMSLALVLGLVGNIIVILVIVKDKKWVKKSYRYILSTAIADFLIVFNTIVTMIYEVRYFFVFSKL